MLQTTNVFISLPVRRGELLHPPPFWIFPHIIFAFLLRLPYGQFTHPLSRYPCIYDKNFKKFFKNRSNQGSPYKTLYKSAIAFEKSIFTALSN